MSYYQISAGNGPAECELAVAKFLAYLFDHYTDIEIIQLVEGRNPGALKSAFLKTEANLQQYLGTIQWICKSPYRPCHKRKNWFINFNMFTENTLKDFDETKIEFQTMRAGGHGGQHVNTTETAVRAIYTPTGYSTVCQDERSQLANKKKAVERIKIHLLLENRSLESESKKEKWSQHNNLKRGDAVASFKGEKFNKI